MSDPAHRPTQETSASDAENAPEKRYFCHICEDFIHLSASAVGVFIFRIYQ